MAVTLPDFLLRIRLVAVRVMLERTAILAQTHRMAQHVEVLISHQVDHRIERVGVKLGGACAAQVQHVAGVFDNRHLHPQANAKERNLVLTGVLDGNHLAL